MSAEQMHSPAWHQLREQILAKAVVHGKVILSSGKEADYYVDLRRVTLDHAAAPLVGQVMPGRNANFQWWILDAVVSTCVA